VVDFIVLNTKWNFQKVWPDAKMSKPRIMCITYTMAKSHNTAIKALKETWAYKCDGFIVMSTETDPSIPAVDIEHEGPEEYNNIWQKMRSIWMYIYKHHYEDYDWFYLGGDDVFPIIENMRLYLQSEEIRHATADNTIPIFLGR